jgi:hypothetical protein
MPACKRALTTCSKLRNDMVNDPRSESGHFFAGFLASGWDFSVALWIIAVGGPVSALYVRRVARVGKTPTEVSIQKSV